MIKKIKKALDCKTDQELLDKLTLIAGKRIAKRQLQRWQDDGFPLSTEALLKLLLNRIENGEIKS